MKFYKLMMSAAACALLASCSSDEPAVNNNNGTESPDGNYYMSFNISLPGSGGETRANQDNGLASEYKVSDTRIYIYDITNGEQNAAFVIEGTQVQGDYSTTGVTDGDVTAQKTVVTRVGNIDTKGSKKYGALVILNAGGLADDGLPKPGQSFGDWMSLAQTCNMKDNSGNFTMTNAARYDHTDAIDGEGNTNKSVKVLYPIDNSKIYATATLATEGDATATIYVERGLAKVQVLTNSEATGGFIPGKDYAENKTDDTNMYKDNKVVFTAWGLDITNTSTYGVTNVDDAINWTKTYFFENTANYCQRLYWGKDPNYDDTELNKFEKARTVFGRANDASVNKLFNADNMDYCLENTFNYTCQYQPQTTRVVMKANYQLTNGSNSSFYRLNSVLYASDDFMTHIQKIAAKAVNTALSNVTVTMKQTDENDKSGSYKLEDVCTIDISNVGELGFDLYDKVAKALGMTDKNTTGIDYYKDGICYYVARIRHFADDADEDNTPSWTSGAYSEKHLGRYGVVRNNWYELTVDAVSGPGEPVIPDPEDVPDDEEEQHIKCSIKILKWAKRTQSVKL